MVKSSRAQIISVDPSGNFSRNGLGGVVSPTKPILEGSRRKATSSPKLSRPRHSTWGCNKGEMKGFMVRKIGVVMVAKVNSANWSPGRTPKCLSVMSPISTNHEQ